jgi:hypothetical protein
MPLPKLWSFSLHAGYITWPHPYRILPAHEDGGSMLESACRTTRYTTTWIRRVHFLSYCWTTKGSEFESLCEQEFSLLYVVQTDCGAHPASYPLVPGAVSLGVKRHVREADHSPPNYCWGQENVGLYIHSSIRLHGRSQWLRCPSHELSSLAPKLWSCVRILLKAWISVLCAFIPCLCCSVCR